MNETGKLLFLTNRTAGEEFLNRLGDGKFVRCDDPYDALMEMRRGRFPAIVLTAPRPGLAGLCRASRRLQPDARIFALCSIASEPEVRSLVGKVLDDYFIYPPTNSELEVLRSPMRQSRYPTAAALPPGELVRLFEAASSTETLEARLEEMVGRRIAAAVMWADAETLNGRAGPLLLTAGDAPRALVPVEPLARIDEAARAFISAVQDCLPVLTATARRTESLHRLAITDHLTGAYNRRYFYHVTDRVIRRTSRKDFRVTLLLYDIDDFKRYNDTYGHAAGDEILRETAALMKRITRTQDIVARIGGDEFAVLFWDTEPPRSPNSQPLQTAYALADRFRKTVQKHEFRSLGPEARGVLTISGGLASYPADGQSCRELLRAADKALKTVKNTGKNAICLVGRD